MTASSFFGFLIGGSAAIILGMVPTGWLLPMMGAAIGAAFALGLHFDEAD